MHRLQSGLVLSFLTLSLPAPAQDPGRFEPVESGVEDVSVLSTSLRVQQPGLDPGTGFDSVYRVPGQSDRYFRANGALFAVFDQSVYRSWNGVGVPEVPPSTTFHIGVPQFLADPVRASLDGTIPARGPFGAGVDRRDADRVTPPRVTPVASTLPVEEVLPRFLTDQAYRGRRLREIRVARDSRPLLTPPD
ncbi:MAG: hypothetical protein VXY94_10470 [Planctomycetota bacterium]|nr:hypothetical protein [Planctomycetota bacterium]MEC9158213.1 hypothetical protein [Planctomycetota bacterium]MEC9234346.1 hypothetical protein [Planctomycetota bacterium]MED6308232.1 hypothetical protein [Planctomycetota bacterium]